VAERKTVVVAGVTLLIVVLIAVVGFQQARAWAKAEVRRVELERDSMRFERDSILAVTGIRDSLKVETARIVDSLVQSADSILRRVESNEAGRARAQLAVRRLRNNEAVEQRVRETFPEFAAAMRVTEDFTDPDFPIEYIGFPVRFAEAFIIHKQNADSFEVQVGLLDSVVTLQGQVVDLKDSIITLTELNEATFRTGYDRAFQRYEARTEEYIRLLNQPRFKFDVPGFATLVAPLAVGFVLGTQIN
jgi:hypothetical protein